MVETRGGRRFAAFFVVAAFLVLFVGRWVKPVDDTALAIAAPFEAVISSVASGAGDTVSGIVEGPSLRSENVRLKQELGQALRQDILLQEQAHENAILRRMLGYRDQNSNIDLLAARVIGTGPNNLEPSVLINRGTRDALRVGMTVLDENGYFVGTISDLTSNQARVELMLSPSSSVGAFDLKTRASGLVEGQYAGRPQFKWVVTHSSLRMHDLVVTSGQMDLYPRMLLLGQIVSIHHSNVSPFQTADIQPAADFQNLELVQVVRNFVPQAPTKLVKSP